LNMRKVVSGLVAIALAFMLSFACGCTVSGNQGSKSSSSTSSEASVSSTSDLASSASASSTAASSSSSSAKSGDYNETYDFYYSDYPKITSHDYTQPNITVTKGESYTSKDEVGLYIHLYGTVPPNYISKTKARNKGWVAEDGNLWDVLPGRSIGGGGWHNDDRELPWAKGREYYECDIDYEGGYRNAKRIVYSDDGLVFYTNDHYNTFEQLY